MTLEITLNVPPIVVHVVHHDPGTDDRFRRIDEQLATLTRKDRENMARDAQLQLFIDRLNASTNEIAKDLKELRDAIKNDTVTDEMLAKLDAAITTNEKLGQDPENPVPEPTPTPEG